MSARLAVLASGGGTNVQALMDYFARDARDSAEIVLVASDRPNAGALQRAQSRGIPTVVLQSSRAPEGASLANILRDARADFVVLAGYLRLLPVDVVRTYAGRIVNVHPALLPRFGGAGMYGHHVHEAVLAAGASESGPTVHFVNEQYDQGAIIAQWAVPVRPDDSADTLAARVLRVEHVLYPRVVQALAAGKVHPGQAPIMGRSSLRTVEASDSRQLIEDIERALHW